MSSPAAAITDGRGQGGGGAWLDWVVAAAFVGWVAHLLIPHAHTATEYLAASNLTWLTLPWAELAYISVTLAAVSFLIRAWVLPLVKVVCVCVCCATLLCVAVGGLVLHSGPQWMRDAFFLHLQQSGERLYAWVCTLLVRSQ